jgi:ornithine cyclodeaminase
MLILNHADVERLLTMEECIPLMESALILLARGEVVQPLRSVVRRPDNRGFLGLMPAFGGGDLNAFGLKAVAIFPENPARGLDSHLGAVLLFSGETGEVLAVINAAAVTAIRTAAVSAVATRLLARPESQRLVIFGTGVQARTHLAAMAAVLPLEHAAVISRDPERGRAFVEAARKRHSFEIELASDADQAVAGADVVVTVTSSRTPVLKRSPIQNGTHINLVGSSVASAREADSETIAAGSLFVDRRESTVNEAGDYLVPLSEGRIGPGHIRAEIGEILTGQVAGRQTPSEITIFKSLGLAIEDLAAASFLYRKGTGGKAGTEVAFD